MQQRWIEHKSGAQVSAEQEVLLRELRARGTQDVVLVANGFTGMTEVMVPDDAHPSPESVRLADALAALADPEAEAPPSTLWEDNSPEVRQVKWLRAVDAAREAQMITTREWAGLYETFGRVGVVRGWHSEASGKEWRAIARRALGERVPPAAAPPAERKASPGGPDEQRVARETRTMENTWLGPASGKGWAGQKYGAGRIEYGQAVPGVRLTGRG